MGRPTIYSQELIDTICTRIIEGDSLRKITNDEAMPALSTIVAWLSSHDDFSIQYARAKEDQADTLADEILHISDTATDPQLGRLRIDTRKWVASKLKPKKYGDKIDHTSDGKALPTPILTLEALTSLRAEDDKE